MRYSKICKITYLTNEFIYYKNKFEDFGLKQKKKKQNDLFGSRQDDQLLFQIMLRIINVDWIETLRI